MDFPKRLSSMVSGIRIAVARDPSHGFFADNLGALLGFVIDDDLIGTVNLIVRKHTVLKDKPSRSPSFAVIDPLVEYPGDSISNQVIDLDILLFSLTEAAIVGEAMITKRVIVVVEIRAGRNRIGSNAGGGGRRRHREVRERRRM